MASSEHVQILDQGASAWNRWRDSHPEIKPDLANADIQDRDLQGVQLQDSMLFCADLRNTNLTAANLRGAYLAGARLENASLFQADIQHGVLSAADLRQANLAQTKLQQANLIQADLRQARLQKANLQGAELQDADLRDADLQDADLLETKGLSAGQLAGTNVSGAKLPNAILQFQGITLVNAVSGHARKLLATMLLGCVYCWLTIATTTDARLLMNAGSSPLPIIGTEIPIVGFYVVAPLILLGLYLYLHVSLQRLWEGLANLPAIFPDGKTLDQRTDPWLLNGLACAHFVRLRDLQPALSRLQRYGSVFLAWWVVPLTQFFFWLRYLPRHDWGVTTLHVMLLVASIGIGIPLYSLANATLCGKGPEPWQSWKDQRLYKLAGGILGMGAIFWLFSLGAIEGAPPKEESDTPAGVAGVRKWVPLALARLRYRSFADLGETEVSTRPSNWTGSDDDVMLVRGADLNKMDMRYANATRAFLVNARLSDVDLRGASLLNADLRGANFFWAKMQGAVLSWAKLRRADLSNADLEGAMLYEADLREAILDGTNLSGANLAGANLKGANLAYAKNVNRAQIESAITDEQTRLPHYLSEVKAP